MPGLALPEVVTALVTTLRAAPGFTDPEQPVAGEVIVYDGPYPTGATETTYVLVGVTGDDTDAATYTLPEDGELAEFDDEAGEIVCSAWADGGDLDIGALRAAAGALVDACRDAINDDPTLGGVLTVGGRARVVSGTYRAEPTIARVTFTVAYTTTHTS